MDRFFVVVGSISALIGVAAGAFGAHALKTRVAPDLLAVFDTASRYQLIHALALLVVGWACVRWPAKAVHWAGIAFLIGTVFFSGGLYAFALSGVRAFAVLAPLGGVALLCGWALLAWGVWRAAN